MKANDFIKKFGIGAAQCVLKNMPRTSTHYVFNKTGFYYSLDFKSYFHEGDWFDSDYSTAEEMEEDYRGNVVDLANLRRLVVAHEVVGILGGLEECKELIKRTVFPLSDRIIKLKYSVSDVESCQC